MRYESLGCHFQKCVIVAVGHWVWVRVLACCVAHIHALILIRPPSIWTPFPARQNNPCCVAYNLSLRYLHCLLNMSMSNKFRINEDGIEGEALRVYCLSSTDVRKEAPHLDENMTFTNNISRWVGKYMRQNVDSDPVSTPIDSDSNCNGPLASSLHPVRSLMHVLTI